MDKEQSYLLIQRHRIDELNWHCTIEELEKELPRLTKEFIGAYYDALAYYKMNNFYESLDDVVDPKEDQLVHIRISSEKRCIQYAWRGKWVYIGDMLDKFIE